MIYVSETVDGPQILVVETQAKGISNSADGALSVTLVKEQTRH